MNGREGERGQVNFDFAVGISILIIAVTVAFSLVPGIFGGVTTSGQQSDEVVADRIAENLVEGSLEDPRNPGTLRTACVRALFDPGLAFCGLSQGVDTNVGQDDRFVNVSVVGNTDPSDGPDQLYWDSGDFTEARSGNFLLAGGDNSNNAENVAVSKRAVVIDGTPARIVVRVW